MTESTSRVCLAGLLVARRRSLCSTFRAHTLALAGFAALLQSINQSSPLAGGAPGKVQMHFYASAAESSSAQTCLLGQLFVQAAIIPTSECCASECCPGRL